MAASQGQLPGQGAPSKASRRSSKEMVRTGLWVVLAVLTTLFALLNVEEVKVDWIFGSSRVPLIIVIAVSLLIGIVLTYAADHRKRRSR